MPTPNAVPKTVPKGPANDPMIPPVPAATALAQCNVKFCNKIALKKPYNRLPKIFIKFMLNYIAYLPL